MSEERPAEEKQEVVVEMEVPPGYRSAQRLDVYLTEHIANATRAKVQRGIKEGMVEVNGRVETRPSLPVQAGDRIACRVMRPPPMEIAPEAIPLDIVFEDEHLIVLDKPAGMVVHPAYGHRSGTLVNALLHHVGAGTIALADDDDEEEEEEIGLSNVITVPRFEGDIVIRPGIVHRLDRGTSGLMVVAKSDGVHAHLARQFAARTIGRRYLAIVWGVPEPPEGRIEAEVGRDPRDRKKMAVVKQGRGKHAVTHYETVEALRHTSLVGFRLETGRTHQIRVHARHIGHPVLGDPTYDGLKIRFGMAAGTRQVFFRNLFERMPRQALHAHTLGIRHPVTKEDLFFESPLPEDMQDVLDRLRAVEGA
jgi:23S rRNA pseudouridine1911/1915/1917 synthase